MRLAFQMSDTFAEVNRRTANGAMNLVAFLKKEFAEVGAVLSCYACNQGNFAIHCSVVLFLFTELLDALLVGEATDK